MGPCVGTDVGTGTEVGVGVGVGVEAIRLAKVGNEVFLAFIVSLDLVEGTSFGLAGVVEVDVTLDSLDLFGMTNLRNGAKGDISPSDDDTTIDCCGDAPLFLRLISIASFKLVVLLNPLDGFLVDLFTFFFVLEPTVVTEIIDSLELEIRDAFGMVFFGVASLAGRISSILVRFIASGFVMVDELTSFLVVVVVVAVVPVVGIVPSFRRLVIISSVVKPIFFSGFLAYFVLMVASRIPRLLSSFFKFVIFSISFAMSLVRWMVLVLLAFLRTSHSLTRACFFSGTDVSARNLTISFYFFLFLDITT